MRAIDRRESERMGNYRGNYPAVRRPGKFSGSWWRWGWLVVWLTLVGRRVVRVNVGHSWWRVTMQTLLDRDQSTPSNYTSCKDWILEGTRGICPSFGTGSATLLEIDKPATLRVSVWTLFSIQEASEQLPSPTKHKQRLRSVAGADLEVEIGVGFSREFPPTMHAHYARTTRVFVTYATPA